MFRRPPFVKLPADGAGVGRSPIEKIRVTREESAQLGKIAKDNLEAAVDEFLAVAEGDGGEEFTGSASADGGVVLERDDLPEDGSVAASEPAEAQPGEAVSLADGAEAEGALIEIAGGGKPSGRIMFELAVDLVGEDVNAMASGEFKDAAENVGRHEQSGGIVRRVNVNGARVRTDEKFEGGEIVGPGVGGIAAPFGNSGARAFGDGESTFVAGSFHDGMILGREQGVIEDEDGFFGGGKHDELMGRDLRVHGGQDIAKPGSAGGFGVTAPVVEEGVVGVVPRPGPDLHGQRSPVGPHLPDRRARLQRQGQAQSLHRHGAGHPGLSRALPHPARSTRRGSVGAQPVGGHAHHGRAVVVAQLVAGERARPVRRLVPERR